MSFLCSRGETYIKTHPDPDGNIKLDRSDRKAVTPGFKTALRHLHVNLGHPTNDDLTRCRTAGGGTRVAQRAVKCMRCSTCKRMSRPRSHRQSHIPTDGERFNERLSADLCDEVDVRGNRHWWLVAVDQLTHYTVIAPCPSHDSQAIAKKKIKHWIRWAGPPDVLVCDGERGLGAYEVLTEKLSVSGTQVRTTAAYSPWQKGRVEQRIATIKEVAGKTMLQHQDVGGRRVSCQLRGCPRAEPKSREVGHPPSYTSFWPANECPRRTDGTRRGRSPSDGGGRRRRAGKSFHHSGFSARGLGRMCYFGSDQKSSCHTFSANENIRVRYPLFLLQALARETSGNGNSGTISGTRGFDWTSQSKQLVGAVWWTGISVRH